MEKIELRCLGCGKPLDVMPSPLHDGSGFFQLVSPCNNCIDEEWKVRAADLSHTISEMKIGIDGLFTLLRECLPYVRDMIGISSSARILESEITELLGGMKCTYFLCNNIAVFAGFCEDHKHRYFATEDD